MATYLDRGNNNNPGISSVSLEASISPTANAFVYFLISYYESSGSTQDAVSGITTNFTTQVSPAQIGSVTPVGSSNVTAEIWYCQAAATPGSGTPSISFSPAIDSPRVFCYEVTSFSAVDHTNTQIVSSAASGTDTTGNFAVAPASGSELLQIVCGSTESSSITMDTGWTDTGEGLAAGSHPSNGASAAGSNGTGMGGTFGTTITGGRVAYALEVADGAITYTHYYGVYTSGSGSSATDANVKAGTGTGYVTSGSQAGVASGTEQAFNVSGLAPNTAYDLEWVANDGTTDTRATSTPFRTKPAKGTTVITSPPPIVRA